MRFLSSILLVLLSQLAISQHTSPLISAGVDKTITLPVNTTSVTGTSTLYDGATAVYAWTKLRTPGMGVRRITVVGSSYSAGFGVGATEGYVYKLKEWYKSLGMLDTIYNLAVSGQTVFQCDITTALNKGADVVIVYYGSNGYRVSDGYTIAQICNRYRELRDSIINRGKEYFFAGTQPRDEWGTTDRARLVEINDSVRNIFGARFIDADKPLRNTSNNTLKTELQLGDGIHVNALGQTILYDLFRAHNVFRFVAAAFDKIRTPSALTTNIDSISRRGVHLYQFAAIDSYGHGGTDVMQVTATSSCGGTAYRPTPAGDGGYFNTNALGAGDTLYLEGGKTFSYVYINNRNGTAACPIIVMNDKGVGKLYRNQLDIQNTTYLKVLGTGTSDQYGIEIRGRGDDTIMNQQPAVSVLGKSKCMEFSNILMRNNGAAGIKIAPPGDCDSTFNYPLWTMDSFSIHDNKIVRTWNEGMYLGNTSPDNGVDSYSPRPVDCGGVTKYPRPPRLGNFKIYNNIVDSTGRGGIQLAAASTGVSDIYNNVIMHSGMNGDDAQGTAISTGAYTKALIYNNTISNTYTWGIALLGASGTNFTQLIQSNTIDSSGYMQHYNLATTGLTELKLSTATVYPNNLSWPHNIFIKSVQNYFIDSTRFNVNGNSFLKRKGTWNIGMLDTYNTFHKIGNFICGNTNTPPAATSINVEGAVLISYSLDCNRRRFKLKVR